jgi:hypothetical protein
VSSRILTDSFEVKRELMVIEHSVLAVSYPDVSPDWAGLPYQGVESSIFGAARKMLTTAVSGSFMVGRRSADCRLSEIKQQHPCQ